MKGFRTLGQKSTLIDVFLVGLIIYLFYILFYKESFWNQESPKVRNSKSSNLRLSRNFEKKLRRMPDVRSDQCKRKTMGSGDKATIVSYFNNYELYDLKVSLTTALSMESSVGEVVVVDDGSSEEHISEEAKRYLETFTVPVKYVSQKVRRGKAGVLNQAIKQASFDSIVFIDTGVLCSRGWLDPLLDHLLQNPDTIVVPHFDKASASLPTTYNPVQKTKVAYLLWNLHTVFRDPKHNKKHLTSPSLRPELFAFKKSLLEDIGGMDINFKLGGGEVAELGMRAWACGKSIQVVPCSRVAILGLDTPLKITSGININQIIGVWFGSNWKGYKPHSSLDIPPEQKKKIQERRNFLFENLKCKGVQWYMEKIHRKSVTLQKNIKNFGLLRCGSNSCMRVAPDNKIELSSCEDMDLEDLREEDVFQLTEVNFLLNKEKCLTITNDMFVVIEDCRKNDFRQMWEFKDNKLINKNNNLCATHVTDPSPNSKRQLVMIQDCLQLEKDHIRFMTWYFFPV